MSRNPARFTRGKRTQARRIAVLRLQRQRDAKRLARRAAKQASRKEQ